MKHAKKTSISSVTIIHDMSDWTLKLEGEHATLNGKIVQDGEDLEVYMVDRGAWTPCRFRASSSTYPSLEVESEPGCVRLSIPVFGEGEALVRRAR
jgi:hypothetical protein